MINGNNAQLPPTVHHRQQTQMVIPHALLWHFAERELVEHFILEKRLVIKTSREHGGACCLDSSRQLMAVSFQHQLEKLGDRLCVLLDLLFRGRIEDGEPGVDMPLIRVDSQRQVYLDVFNASEVSAYHPRELFVGGPCCAHANVCEDVWRRERSSYSPEEGRMCDRLSISCDAIMCFGGEINVL